MAGWAFPLKPALLLTKSETWSGLGTNEQNIELYPDARPKTCNENQKFIDPFLLRLNSKYLSSKMEKNNLLASFLQKLH